MEGLSRETSPLSACPRGLQAEPIGFGFRLVDRQPGTLLAGSATIVYELKLGER